MRAVTVVLCSLLLLCSSSGVSAAEGDLDPGFATGGVATEPLTGMPRGTGVVLQDDGKIVSATIDDDGLKFYRYDSTGMPDATFGVAGVVTNPAPGSFVSELRRQSDGKLVVLLNAGGAVARYADTGAPDGGFGTGGVTATPCGGVDGHLLIAPDGTLVVGTANLSPIEGCVARFDASGGLDPAFGVGGVVTLADFGVFSLAAQGGQFLLGGIRAGDPPTASVMRLDGDGIVDGGFGTGGVFSQTLAWPYPYVTALDVAAGGDVLALAARGEVMRLSSSGKLDTSFGSGGVAAIDIPVGFGDDVLATALAVQSDGRILGAATRSLFIGPPIGYIPGVKIFRYDVDGTVDATFGVDGIADGIGGNLGGFALQSDGKFVLSTAYFDPFESFLTVR